MSNSISLIFLINGASSLLYEPSILAKVTFSAQLPFLDHFFYSGYLYSQANLYMLVNSILTLPLSIFMSITTVVDIDCVINVNAQCEPCVLYLHVEQW